MKKVTMNDWLDVACVWIATAVGAVCGVKGLAPDGGSLSERCILVGLAILLILCARLLQKTLVYRDGDIEQEPARRAPPEVRAAPKTGDIDDVLLKYDTIIKFWPAGTIDIRVKTLGPAPVQRVITSRPASGTELLEAVKEFHGDRKRTTYELTFVDIVDGSYRGRGHLVIPDARPS